MVAIISFGVSLLGILSLILFKRWEDTREPSLYREWRAVLDRYTVWGAHVVRKVPHIVKMFLSRILHAVVFYISAFVLRVVRFVERKLFKFVNMVKGRHETHHKKGSVSLFLTSISDTRDSPHREG